MGENWDAFKEASKDMTKAAWRGGKKTGAKVARASSQKFWRTMDNSHATWRRFGLPLMAGAATYYAMDNFMGDWMTPGIDYVTQYSVPLLSYPSEWSDKLINHLQTPDQSTRNTFLSAIQIGKDYAINNIADIVQHGVAIGLGATVAAASRQKFPIDLPNAQSKVDRIKRQFGNGARTIANGMAIGLLAYATVPTMMNVKTRVIGEDIGSQIEQMVQENPDFAQLNNSLVEILMSGDVTMEKLNKDVAYLKSIGYSDITARDLFYKAKMIAAEAGNSQYQFTDMKAVSEAMDTRYAMARMDKNHHAQFYDANDPTFAGSLLKKVTTKRGTTAQFSPALNRRNIREWDEAFKNGSLTYKTGSAEHAKNLLAYAAGYQTFVEMALGKIPITRGAPNFINEDVSKIRWEGKRYIDDLKYTRAGKYGNHNFYLVLNPKGENVGMTARNLFAADAKKTASDNYRQ